MDRNYIKYMKKLHNNHNVYIHNYRHADNMINDEEDEFQLI